MESEITFGLVVGVVASLLSVLLSLVIKEFWLKILVPWYEEKLYKGAEVAGVWSSCTVYSDGGENLMTYIINRKGYRIWGEIRCTEGIDKGQSWLFTGSFKDLILSALYESSNPRVLDKGSLTLMLNHNGERLTGHLIYYANIGNQMKSTPLELKLGGLK